jgi:hypothetical protein
MMETHHKLNEFIRRTEIYRLNVLYLDFFQSTNFVTVSRLLNDPVCNDNLSYWNRSNPLNCFILNSRGRCNNPDEFMRNNCKRTW